MMMTTRLTQTIDHMALLDEQGCGDTNTWSLIRRVITTFNGRWPQCQSVLAIIDVSIAIDYLSVEHMFAV